MSLSWHSGGSLPGNWSHDPYHTVRDRELPFQGSPFQPRFPIFIVISIFKGLSISLLCLDLLCTRFPLVTRCGRRPFFFFSVLVFRASGVKGDAYCVSSLSRSLSLHKISPNPTLEDRKLSVQRHRTISVTTVTADHRGPHLQSPLPQWPTGRAMGDASSVDIHSV
jgi:hypothetical protein